MAKAGFLDRLSPLRAETAHRPMLLIILLLGLVGFFWEHVPAGDGLGWDGTIYARMVADLPGMISRGEINSYHAQRILPSFVVSRLLAVTGTAVTDTSVVHAFRLYNLALLLASCFLWRAVADIYRLGASGRWIGFCALFLSFQTAKLTYYYPVLTDTTALAFGMLTLFLYATGRSLLLMLASVLAAACWPTFGVCGALLLLFPRADEAVLATPERSFRARPFVGLYLALCGGAIALYLLMVAMREASCALVTPPLTKALETLGSLGVPALHSSEIAGDPCGAVRRLLTSLPSVAGMALGLLVLLVPLLSGTQIATHLRRIRPLHVVYALLTIALPIGMVKLIADPNAPVPSSLRYIASIILLPAEGKVFMPLLGAFVYWGPLVVVAILLWSDACRAARRLGLGAVLTIAFTLPFGLVGEGRFLTAAWPFMVLAVALALNERPPGLSFWLPFAVVTVAFAQFWLPLNIRPWTGGPLDYLLEFPKQMYFMHFGPWMNWATFAIQFGIMAATAAILHAALRGEAARARPRP